MKPAIVFLILLLAALALFSRSARGPFLYDDEASIIENRYLVGGGDKPTLKTIMGNFSFSFQRPIPTLSFALDRVVFGQKTLGFHLNNIFLHALFCFFVFRLSLVLLADFSVVKSREGTFWVSLATALIVLVHPLTTESVSYLSSRPTLFAWLLIAAALLIFPAKRALTIKHFLDLRLLGAFALAGLAFLSKEEAAVYPFILFSWVFLLPDRKSVKPIQWLKIFLFPTLFFLAAIFIVASYDKGLELTRFRTFSVQAMTQTAVTWRYVLLYFFPFFQNIDPDIVEITSPLNPSFLLAFLVWLALGTWLWMKRKTSRFYGLLLCFFILGLAISSAVPLPDLMAERRAYFSLFPLSLALCAFVYNQKKSVFPWITTGAICFFSIMNFQRQVVFTSEFNLWQDAVQKSPKKWRPHFNFGNALREQIKTGKTDIERQTAAKRAIASYEQAVFLNPTHIPALSNLGHLYYSTGDFEKAREVYLSGLRVKPDSPELRVNLGMLYYQARNLSAAKENFEYALRAQPENASALLNLGMVYHQENQTSQALDLYLRAIQSDPKSAPAHNNLCVIYKEMGRLNEAMNHCKIALHENPNLQMAYLAVAEIYLEAKAVDYAIINLEKLLKINPGHMHAWFLMARTAVMRNEKEQAKVFFNNARIYAQRVNDQKFMARIEKELKKL